MSKEEESKEMQSALETLQCYVDASARIVFFGGAGVSTESGIRDFRSVDGLYHLQYKYNPETILSRSFFLSRPEEFFAFYQDKIVQPTLAAQPNAAHLTLARLEALGKLTAVVTQNIDGLHQMAGSRNVLELHGSIHRNTCMRCGARYTLAEQQARRGADGVPRCDCGGIIRPDVVLYEEPLDTAVVEETVRVIREADLLIVGGTSLKVYPAAGFLEEYRGDRLVVINLEETSYHSRAALVVREKIGRVLGQLRL